MSPLLMMAEGGNASEAQIKAAFIEKLGREPEAEAVRYYKTQSPEKLSSDIDSSSERAAILTRASTTQTSSSSGGGGGGSRSSGTASANKSVLDSIKQIYLEQLGRPADPEGLDFYANQIATGKKTAAQVAEELDRTTDGFNYDRQQIVSAYRKNFGRNPDQAGIQYWMGQEDKDLYSQEQFANLFKGAAGGVDVQALANNPEGFTKFLSDALAADPYFGGFAVDNPYIYDEATAKLRPNVSRTAAGQYVQFVDPITQRPAYSGYTPDGQFKVFAGNDVLQPDRIRQAVNLATISGSLSQADADRILNAVSSPEKFRQITGNKDPNANTLYALLSEPKATIVLDALGVQIGEDADASLAMAESAARQRIVDRAREQTGQNINPATLLQADVAREMGAKFPFTKDNLTLDPLTGKPIRTMMTAEDVANNIFTFLNIPTDKELKNIILTPPGGTTSGGGTTTTPGAVTGTTGDFRGLAFPEARPTTISETPAMLNFAPYTLTQAGSGQQKTTEPQPVIPIPKDTRVDPTTGTLLGAVIGSLMPTPSDGGVLQGVSDIFDAVSGGRRSDYSRYNVDASSVPIADNSTSSYNRLPVRNIINADSSSYYRHGGLATPLMKEGGMVPHFADGGTSQVLSGLDKIISAPSARGALIGALMTQLMNAQAQSQAANAYRGIDMSKVGVIPPRTTQIGPVRFAPYRQYASAPEIPQSISSPINIGALRASQTPMTSFTPTMNMVNPLARPLNEVIPTQMADGGAAYYTYGQHIDPMQYLEGMAQGGMAHGGLNEVHHADNAPLVQGRKDYRAGSAVTGPGDGQSDDIPAMLADGEYVFDADTVAQLGNGSTKAGSKILDRFREELRAHKRSAPVNKIPPPSKSPLAYLAEAQKKMKGARRG
jgi:hypothetical protein